MSSFKSTEIISPMGRFYLHVSCYAENLFLTSTWPRSLQDFPKILQEYVHLCFAVVDKPRRTQLDIGGCSYGLSFCDKHLWITSSCQQWELLAMRYGLGAEEFHEHIQRIQSLNIDDFPTVYEDVVQKHKLPDLLDELTWGGRLGEEKTQAVEESMHKYAAKLNKELSHYHSTFLEKLTDYALSLTANYEALRLHLLKFLALLPCIGHDKEGVEVKRLFIASLTLLKNTKPAPSVLPKWIWGLSSIARALTPFIPAYFLASMIRFLTAQMAKRFIAGENITKSGEALVILDRSGRSATLDQLGELAVSTVEADKYCQLVIEMIEGLGDHYQKGELNKALLLKAQVSVKVSALCPQMSAFASLDAQEKVYQRLEQIFLAAKKNHVFVNIDAEHYHFRDLVWSIYKKLLQDHQELQDFAGSGIVVQAYLRDATAHLQEIMEFSRKRKILMPIRLVKGAYWDGETLEASAHHHNAFQYLNKVESDLSFRHLCYLILKEEYLQLTLGSHNVMDHCFALALKEEVFSQARPIEHQCLHMTYEALSVSLSRLGLPVRNYMPVGDLLIGMGYLVRRIMENSSQVGVLSRMRSGKKSDAQKSLYREFLAKRAQFQFDQGSLNDLNSFVGCAPFRPFDQEHKKHLEHILKKPTPLPTVELTKLESLTSLYKESKDLLQDSQESKQWCESHRAEALLKSAAELLFSRSSLAHMISVQSHKTLLEAHADVDEAVDFILYAVWDYLNYLSSKPLGLVVAIAPWNFPVAIPCGMISSALMAGNCVFLKSAEQTPNLAEALCAIFWKNGVPTWALRHLVGTGEQLGEALTQLPMQALVFTGSRSVGMYLHHKLITRNDSFPRVITEMGGKNAIIVTQNAEPDEAIAGILSSALSHAGQKCSACSRVFVDKRISEFFFAKLKCAFDQVAVGPALSPETVVNPLIDEVQKQRVLGLHKLILEEVLHHGGHVLVDRLRDEVGPMLIELPTKRAYESESFSNQELFAPIVHLFVYNDLKEALMLFNATDYALTGGIFSQSHNDIDYFIKQAQAGNLYINRPCTGARVGIEPFGGYKASGSGPKAGSPVYLSTFLHATETQDLSFLKDMGSEERKLQLQLEKKGLLLAMDMDPKHYKYFSQLLAGDVQRSQWPNLSIPGQKSWSDFSCTIENALVLVPEDLNPNVIFFILLCLKFNLKITLISHAIDRVSRDNFSMFKFILQKHNASASMLFHLASEEQYEIDMDKMNLIYLGVKPSKVFAPWNKVAGKFVTPEDFLEYTCSLRRMLTLFCQERSIAYNTLRHGAAME
jgi:RHH-type proline utilization regulon transcriptional repressor/proline dehydrogenase/delta 1-pyrroline-5-carboxylate dehydrogenase